MKSEYILPIGLGIGTGLLLLIVLALSYKLFNDDQKFRRMSRRHKKSIAPTIIPQDIPGFMLPTWRNVRVQEPLRKFSRLGDDSSTDELDLDTIKARTNNNIPVSTVIAAGQSTPELREMSKMELVSQLKTKTLPRITGSISLQDLNVYSPKARCRKSLVDEELMPSLKFALYYSVATSELNITVISVHNLTHLASIDSPNLSVWVQVEFSRYHQEFRTRCCSLDSEPVFNETCVVSEFPVEHFTGSKVSFRVLHDNSTVVAEAVYVLLGLPPSFPRNEAIELQHPGIVQSSQSPKCGEMLVRLKYDPVEEVVTLGIVECRGLRSARKKHKILDTYVKVHVIFCDETVQRFKTKLVQKTNNPKYETTFTLAGFFSRGKMTQTLVKLTVYAKSVTRCGVGHVLLGTGRQTDRTASGYQHWETIVDKPQLDISQWHVLKPVRSMTP